MKRFLYDTFDPRSYYFLVKEFDDQDPTLISVNSYAYFNVLTLFFYHDYLDLRYRLYQKRNNTKLEFVL